MPLETPILEVPAEAAYAAATERALKTTHALILAEAQVLSLRAELGDAYQRANDAEKLVDATKRLMERRVATLLRRAEAAEGVMSDAPDDEVRADTCREADPSHDFSD